MWILFSVPCPTPDGRTAQNLYQARVDRIGPEMQASARGTVAASTGRGTPATARCSTRWRSWRPRTGTGVYWSWDIQDEPGEMSLRLEGDGRLVSWPGPAAERG
jgi:hypothetical protein